MTARVTSPTKAGRGEARAEDRVRRLRDGSPIVLRSVTADDEAGLRAFLGELCPEARRLRFFTGAANLDFAAHLAASTGADRHGLVALDQAGVIVGHALYVRSDPKRAEVGVEVCDRLHGQGLGTMLIEQLAVVAQGHGIARFTAQVLPENRAMLDVFRDGFVAGVEHCHGVDAVEFATAGARLTQRRVEGEIRPSG